MKIKNLLIILTIILMISLILSLICKCLGKLEEKKLENFMKKAGLVKVGMSEKEVIKILGDPYIKGWVEIKEENKVKRYYVLIYVPSIVKIRLLKSTWPMYEIYLDKEGGTVVWKPLVLPLY